MNASQRWQEIFLRFDPEQPVPLDRPNWHADRSYSPLLKIEHKLSLPIGTPRILLLGTVGTGKTSELRRLVRQRRPHEFVLRLDLVEHFDQVVGNPEGLQQITTWELCFLLGLALYQAAQEQLGLAWPADVLPQLDRAWREAAKAAAVADAPAQLDLAKLGKTLVSGAATALGGPAAGAVVAGGLHVAEAALDGLRWTLPLGKAPRALSDDTEQSRGVLMAVNRIIGEIQHRHGRVLPIIDGLDRIRDTERARALFIESGLLGRLICPIVVCGPFALRHHPTVSMVRGFEIMLLVNEPVVRQDDPGNDQRPGNGIAFLYELFRLRTQDLQGAGSLIGESLLRRLAYYSGGRARDFVRLVRLLAEEVLGSNAGVATPQHVEAAIEEARRLLEIGVHRGHIEVLRSVMADPEHRLPQHELVWELLASWRLLPYPNRSEWFYPHPLLTLELVRPTGTMPSPAP